MATFKILQTASHAVLVVCVQDIDPTSVSVEISTAKDAIHLKYEAKKEGNVSQVIYPRLCLAESKLVANALIEEYTLSVTHRNLVIRMKKQDPPCDWESLEIHFAKGQLFSLQEDSTEKEQERPMERLFFVTEGSVQLLQKSIQVRDPWGVSGMLNDMVVKNVNARKVPMVNAIEITAGLAPKSSE